VRYPLSVRRNPHHATDTSHGELAVNETTVNDSVFGPSQPADAADAAVDDDPQQNGASLDEDETSAAVTSEHGSVLLQLSSFIWTFVLPAPFLLGYSVFVFIMFSFSLFFRFCAVR